MWDYDAMTALGADYPPNAVFLSGMTIVLALAALQTMENRWTWESDGEPLDDSQEDERDKIVSQAEYELTTGSLSVVYAGSLMAYAGATIPTGWLECDGSSKLRSDYPTLFAAIGTTWGAADGTHFNLPDLRGRAAIGAGSGSGLTARTLAQTGGAETNTLLLNQIPSHVHTIPLRNDTGAVSNPTVRAGGAATAQATADTGPAGGTAGVTQAHNNMQPFAVVKWMIATGQ